MKVDNNIVCELPDLEVLYPCYFSSILSPVAARGAFNLNSGARTSNNHNLDLDSARILPVFDRFNGHIIYGLLLPEAVLLLTFIQQACNAVDDCRINTLDGQITLEVRSTVNTPYFENIFQNNRHYLANDKYHSNLLSESMRGLLDQLITTLVVREFGEDITFDWLITSRPAFWGQLPHQDFVHGVMVIPLDDMDGLSGATCFHSKLDSESFTAVQARLGGYLAFSSCQLNENNELTTDTTHSVWPPNRRRRVILVSVFDKVCNELPICEKSILDNQSRQPTSYFQDNRNGDQHIPLSVAHQSILDPLSLTRLNCLVDFKDLCINNLDFWLGRMELRIGFYHIAVHQLSGEWLSRIWEDIFEEWSVILKIFSCQNHLAHAQQRIDVIRKNFDNL